MSHAADAALSARLQPPLAAGAAVVAYSGGLDSTVLLHLAMQARLPGLCAVHVHHGLQAAADDWATHCEATCRRWQVPIEIHHVQVQDDGEGPEAAARRARYAALQLSLPTEGWLLTAHHREDQAETLLLRLLRGTGVTGLAAMPALSRFGRGWLWRPLLEVSRAELRDYATRHALQWIEDPHNADARYARSALRTTVLPAVRARWPQWDAQLARTAAHAAEAAELLSELAQGTVGHWQRPDGGLSLAALRTASPALRRLVLRHWIARNGLPLPSADNLVRCETELIDARADAQPIVSWPGAELRRYRQALYVAAPLPPLPDDTALWWDGRQPLALPGAGGVLTAAQPFERALCVRFARGGERLRPGHDPHTRTLKYLAQSAGWPPWLRGRLPLLCDGERVLSIAGRWAVAGAPAVRWQIPDWPGVPSSWRVAPGP